MSVSVLSLPCTLPEGAVEFRVAQAVQATCCTVIVRRPGRLEASAAKLAACFSHRPTGTRTERAAWKDGRAHLLGLKRLWTRRRRDVSAPPRPTHRGFGTGGSSPSPYSNLTAALPRHVTASLLRPSDSRMGRFGGGDATKGRFAVRRGHGDGDRRGERQEEKGLRIKSGWRSAVVRKARLRGRSGRRRFQGEDSSDGMGVAARNSGVARKRATTMARRDSSTSAYVE